MEIDTILALVALGVTIVLVGFYMGFMTGLAVRNELDKHNHNKEDAK